MEPPGESPTQDPRFWRDAATRLKQTADAAWTGYRRTGFKRLQQIEPQAGLERTALRSKEEDLADVYLYLIGLSIELMAIARLIQQDPTLFERTIPIHHILELVNACGVSVNPTQERILRDIGTAFQWGAHTPVRMRTKESEVRHSLRSVSTPRTGLSPAVKEELDSLFAALQSDAQPPAPGAPG